MQYCPAKFGFFAATCVIALSLASPPSPSDPSQAYYGIYLGNLNNATYGISGEVWLANATALQITNFNVDKQQSEQEISFVFSTSESVEPVRSIYKVIGSAANGVQYSVLIKNLFDKGAHMERLVVVLSKNTIKAWSHFGLVSGKTWKYLAAVKLNKEPPRPYCCLTHPIHSSKGIIGMHYNASTGPISIVNSKTLILKHFALDGTKAPDGWIFAGNGQVQRTNGQKAMVVGRDTPTRQCSLKKNYRGDSDLIVQLNNDQTIYNIDFLSIFCYQYDVDFGHMEIQLNPTEVVVPAFIPPILQRGELNSLDDDDNSCPLYE